MYSAISENGWLFIILRSYYLKTHETIKTSYCSNYWFGNYLPMVQLTAI